MLDAVEKAGRAEEVKALVPPEEDPQQGVEAGEVVHVGVRDEGVAHLQELARGERREVPEVEEKGAAVEMEVDVEPRVAERVVDQPGVEEGFHPSGRARPPYRSTQ